MSLDVTGRGDAGGVNCQVARGGRGPIRHQPGALSGCKQRTLDGGEGNSWAAGREVTAAREVWVRRSSQ